MLETPKAMNATTQLEMVNVNAEKIHGYCNGQSAAKEQDLGIKQMQLSLKVIPENKNILGSTFAANMLIECQAKIKSYFGMFLLQEKKRQCERQNTHGIARIHDPFMSIFPVRLIAWALPKIDAAPKIGLQPIHKGLARVHNANMQVMTPFGLIKNDANVSFSINDSRKVSKRLSIHIVLIALKVVVVNYILFKVQRLSRKRVQPSGWKRPLPYGVMI
jgi:hypothetical protein